MVEVSLREGSIRGVDRQHALVCQIFGILQSAAKDNGHDLAGSSPLLGLPGPDPRPNVLWSPAEASAVDARHREAGAPEATKKQLMAPTEGERPKPRARISPTTTTATTCESRPNRRNRKRERKGQSSRAKSRLGHDLHDAGPPHPRGRARQFPRHVFCIDFLFSRETEVSKLVSEEITTPRARHTSRRRRIPMPASPHQRARCNRHAARARIVALISCSLVRLST